MDVHFTPDLEEQLIDLSAQTGQPADELVQSVMAGYVRDLAGVREIVDSRYEDLKSGRVQLIDGEAFFESLKQREDALLMPQ